MNSFPIDPALSRALIASKELGCVHEMLGIVSILSASSKLFFDSIEQRDTAAEARMRFRHGSGDHLTALSALRAYEELTQDGVSRGARKDWCRKHYLNERTLSEALNIQEQLRGLCKRQGYDCSASSGDKSDPILKSLLRGLVQHVAILRPEGGYKQLMGQSVSNCDLVTPECSDLLLDCKSSPWLGAGRPKGTGHYVRRACEFGFSSM